MAEGEGGGAGACRKYFRVVRRGGPVTDTFAVQGSRRGKGYHIIAINETDNVVLMMTTYGTLEHLKGSDTQRSHRGAGGELVTKLFNYREVFGNHFNYRHQVDDNNNWLHSPISVVRGLGLKSIGPTGVMHNSWH